MSAHYALNNSFRVGRWALAALLTMMLAFAGMQRACGQEAPNTTGATEINNAEGGAAHSEESHGEKLHGAEGHEGAEEPRGTFDAEHGTILNPIARAIFGLGPVKKTPEGEYENVKYDFVVVEVLAMLGLVLLSVKAAKGLRLRPEGKPTSATNLFEAAVEGFRTYLIGVMGQPLAMKYAPLVSAYFFTILTFNYLGLVPFLLSPTTNPNIPLGLAIVAFFCVHGIALKEAGFKSWIMHFVGEPVWLAPLNFPLHIIGEFIKPMSLAIRLLCNVFGEEMIVAQITLLGIGIAASLHLPAIIPLQLPFMLLGVFFGFLQALVFSTLLAIYISIFATHHDDHDEHNIHGHVEDVRLHGHHEIIGHPSEATVA